MSSFYNLLYSKDLVEVLNEVRKIQPCFSPISNTVFSFRRELLPVCMIYQTDGQCNSFPEQPPYPVLWVLTRRYDGFNAPFGEVINL